MEPSSACGEVAPVFLEYEEKLKAFIRKRIPDEEESKDLLQQVLLKLYRHCEKLPEVKNMQAWVYQVSRNALNDYFKEAARRKSTHQPLQVELQLEGVEEDRLQKEMVEYVRPLIALLPLKYARPLIMSDLEGYSQQQVADHLGISLSGAKSRVQRAREKLREIIIECCLLELDRNGKLLSLDIKDSCGCMQKVKEEVRQKLAEG
ncbi:RNA polymerase sigma factor SigZ [Nafulsella turpanensis]|uniref:RNA polymerase sigma factor SigZ n=1 Tax=Nafulsella turpanensis TaxID=1265690 RepID=UPI0003486B15|nr:RNA polymerase sigma factor SigZ [Nafulsella turpanensis]